MHTAICDELGIEFPIFAFTHCRDVVVAVSKAGGFGVLGAVGFTPEQLEIELNWIDENIGDHPYGVDIVIPNKYEGMDSHLSAEELAETLRKMVPQEHLDFGKKILADHGVPDRGQRRRQPAAARLDRGDGHTAGRGGAQAPEGEDDRQRARHPAGRDDQAHPRSRTARWPRCAAPPRRPASTPTRASTSSSPRAARPAGTAARWAQLCCGRRSSRRSPRYRCWPRAASAAASRSPRRWRWAAQGAWTGSQWLMVEESSNTPVQQAAYVKAGSRDTVRSRSFTGKPARMLRNDWTEAWEQPDNPKPLGMPLQYMVSGMAVRATNRYPNESVDVAFNPVGQVVGQFTKVEKTRDGHRALGAGVPRGDDAVGRTQRRRRRLKLPSTRRRLRPRWPVNTSLVRSTA